MHALAQEKAREQHQEAQAAHRDEAHRNAMIAVLGDLDTLAEILDDILVGYRPSGIRDDLMLPSIRARHYESAMFIRSLYQVLDQHPNSYAYAVFMSEVRQRAAQDVRDQS